LREKHYRLVPQEEVSPEDIESYRVRSGNRQQTQ
jgi:hypothetical protein